MEHDVGNDPSFTLAEWAMFIEFLRLAFGDEVELYAYAGHSNIILYVEDGHGTG